MVRISKEEARPVTAGEEVHSAVRRNKLVFFIIPPGEKLARRVIVPHNTLVEDGTGIGRFIEVLDPKTNKPHFGIFEQRGGRRGVWWFEHEDHTFTVLKLPEE